MVDTWKRIVEKLKKLKESTTDEAEQEALLYLIDYIAEEEISYWKGQKPC